MKRTVIILIHSLFWLGNLVVLFIILALLCQSDLIEESEGFFLLKLAISLVLGPALFSFYSYYLYLFPKYLQQRKISQAVLSGIILTLLGTALSLLLMNVLLGVTLDCYKESHYVFYPITILIGLLYGTVAIVIKGFITWYQELKWKEELQQKNHKMELALVKSQLDPHFLFNTINNIDVLILKDAEEASHYLNKLSDIMRFMLFETKPEEIPLRKEIEYIEKYIELQKIRTANKHYVTYKISGQQVHKNIAPMVFIPFIENAFKHTTNKKIENAIQIEITILDKSITLQCINKFDQHRAFNKDSLGLGNDLISKRLKLIYPDRHKLTVNQEEDIYTVHLTIFYE